MNGISLCEGESKSDAKKLLEYRKFNSKVKDVRKLIFNGQAFFTVSQVLFCMNKRKNNSVFNFKCVKITSYHIKQSLYIIQVLR